MFEKDIKIRINVKEGVPNVSIIGICSHGELRVLVKLLEDEYNKHIREIRHERRVEQPKPAE